MKRYTSKLFIAVTTKNGNLNKQARFELTAAVINIAIVNFAFPTLYANDVFCFRFLTERGVGVKSVYILRIGLTENCRCTSDSATFISASELSNSSGFTSSCFRYRECVLALSYVFGCFVCKKEKNFANFRLNL